VFSPTRAQIYIKTLTGRKQALNFEPDNQILQVKQALQEKEGIQVDQIKLIHSGKQLADDKSLESYNITAGATIHMVLQLRGGGQCGHGAREGGSRSNNDTN
jgi:Ubiquitin family